MVVKYTSRAGDLEGSVALDASRDTSRAAAPGSKEGKRAILGGRVVLFREGRCCYFERAGAAVSGGRVVLFREGGCSYFGNAGGAFGCETSVPIR